MENENNTQEQPKSMLEQAKEERQAMEKTLAEIKAERQELEKLKSEQILGGTADAGKPEPKPKEESPREYAERMSRGG